MSNNPVVHFEMPYEDATRAADFYKTVFGWDMQNTGNEMGDYILAITTDVDDKQMPTTPGAINGGLYPLKSAPEHKEPSLVISVDDLDKALADIKASGGTIIREPEEIPGIGMWASFRDTEGNRVSVLKPNPRDDQAA